MPKSINKLPEKLQEIRSSVRKYRLEKTLFELEHHSRIESFLNRKNEHLPSSIMENDGEAHFLGALSPGCQACKLGRWECIFVTMECNTDCDFCWRPTHATPAHLGSVFGDTPEKVAAHLEKKPPAGISFSGGEPFLFPDNLLAWIKGIVPRFEETYFWIYTNGLVAGKEILKAVAAEGVHEVRFNLAATGYNHPDVMKNLTEAVRLLPKVTVEIPAIPEHRESVLKHIYTWAELGVRHVNLHELIYEPGTNSAVMQGCRKPLQNPDGHVCHFNPESRDLTLAVMAEVSAHGIPIHVNDCSISSKLRQIRGRRLFLSEHMRKPYEEVVNGELSAGCAYNNEALFFFRPSEIKTMKEKHEAFTFIQVSRLIPLSAQASDQWVRFEPM